MAGGPSGPVFLTLQKPFTALCVTSVKQFRCTGATNAIAAGMDPAQVQALGHWKSEDTFRKHYVHVHPQKAQGCISHCTLVRDCETRIEY